MNKSIVLPVIITAILAFSAGWYLSSLSAIENEALTQDNSNASHDVTDKTTLLPASSHSNERQEESNPQNTSPDLSDSDDDSSIALLSKKNEELQQKLSTLEKSSSEKYVRLERKFNHAQRILADHGKALETISEEEASKLLPKPFSDLMAGNSGSIVKQFKELHAQEQDYDWATDTQQRIYDFFIIHELASGVELQSVICKQTICEIRGFETNEKALSQIMSAMSAQEWWQFNSTHSSSSNSDEYGRYFYILTSRN